MTEETILSPRGDEPPGGNGSAADIDERLIDRAVDRGFITQIQGRTALARARDGRRGLVSVLVERGLISREDADDLDEEVREDFLPGYRVLSRLGEGGMGVVYKALQKRLDREVALKVVTPRLAGDSEYLARFEREAKAVAKLNHPNIVAAYDFGESRGRVYLAMEYVEGTNLADEIHLNGRMEEERALALVREVCAGLAHAAASGITHRDIKPANILLCKRAPGATAGGTTIGVKITDLGLARFGESGGATELTAAGMILGTPGYMAPEQAMGGTVDLRADIYAVGATLYQLVTGQRPFDATTPVAVIARQQTDRLDDPRSHVPGLSEGLVLLLQGMMAKDPVSRYPDYRTLLVDIDAVRQGGRPAFAPPPRGHESIAAFAGVPASAAPATVVTEHVDTGTVALERPPPPAKSRMPVMAVVAILAAVAGAVLVATKPWKRGAADTGVERGDGVPADGSGDPGDGSAPAQVPEDDDEPLPDIGSAREDAEIRKALDRLSAVRAKYAAQPPAGRKGAAAKTRRLQVALAAAQKRILERIEELWRDRRYGEALSLGVLAQEKLGREHAGEAVDRIVKTLKGIGDAEAARESDVLEKAEAAIATKAPLSVLEVLRDFEKRFPFSPRIQWAEDAVAEARKEAPEISVVSDPAGALVIVDGVEMGRTPLEGRRVPRGTRRLRLTLEGHESLEREVSVERMLPQVFTYTLTPLPPPDPEPAVTLVQDGDPRPMWTGRFSGAWSPVRGQWSESHPEDEVVLGGKAVAEPPSTLRGAGRTLSMARMDLAPYVGDAPGWKLEWMMIGAKSSAGITSRVELHFCVNDDDTALVVGLDDQDAYLGRRDLASRGALERLRRWKGVAANERHTFVVEDHGDVFRVLIDGRFMGSIEVPSNRVAARTLRVAVEEGVGFFSDMQRWLLRRP